MPSSKIDSGGYTMAWQTSAVTPSWRGLARGTHAGDRVDYDKAIQNNAPQRSIAGLFATNPGTSKLGKVRLDEFDDPC